MMNEEIHNLIQKIRQDFISLSDTLFRAEQLYDRCSEDCKNAQEALESLKNGKSIWIARVLTNYKSAVHDVLKVTLFPKEMMEKHLDENKKISESEKQELLKNMGFE